MKLKAILVGWFWAFIGFLVLNVPGIFIGAGLYYWYYTANSKKPRRKTKKK